MIRLRPYKSCDAKTIISWIKDEETFFLWSGDHFGSYPINAETLDHKYRFENGDCVEEDNFYPMVAYDEEGLIGSFIIRYLDGNKKILRFGWVIVDDLKRGRKYGQEMLKTGLKLAFEIMGAEKVTIGVLENNKRAYRCYEAVGFREVKEKFDEERRVIEMQILKEDWKLS